MPASLLVMVALATWLLLDAVPPWAAAMVLIAAAMCAFAAAFLLNQAPRVRRVHWRTFDGRRACEAGSVDDADESDPDLVTCPECRVALMLSGRA